jgi:hypothetical protein
MEGELTSIACPQCLDMSGSPFLNQHPELLKLTKSIILGFQKVNPSLLREVIYEDHIV